MHYCSLVFTVITGSDSRRCHHGRKQIVRPEDRSSDGGAAKFRSESGECVLPPSRNLPALSRTRHWSSTRDCPMAWQNRDYLPISGTPELADQTMRGLQSQIRCSLPFNWKNPLIVFLDFWFPTAANSRSWWRNFNRYVSSGFPARQFARSHRYN